MLDVVDAAKMSPVIPTRRLEMVLLKKPTMGPMKKPMMTVPRAMMPSERSNLMRMSASKIVMMS